MKHKIIIYALLSLVVPLHMAFAYGPQGALPNSHTLDNQLNHSFVYIDEDARESMMELLKLLPQHAWSPEFKDLCQDMHNEGNVACHEQMDCVVNECLAVLKRQQNNQFHQIKNCLKKYKETLDSGKAQMQLSDIASEPTTRSSSKTFCKLAASCLNVTGHLFVNGVDYSNPTALVGALGAAGLRGATGATGTSGIIGYAEFINITTPPTPNPNTAVVPLSTAGTGEAFTLSTQVSNTIPGLTTTALVVKGAQGTVFQFATPGTYVLDYEMSLLTPGSVGLYVGANQAALALDTNTIAGSTTATTWIHGRAIEVVPVGGSVIAISNVVGSSTVTTAGSAPQDIIRLTILQVA